MPDVRQGRSGASGLDLGEFTDAKHFLVRSDAQHSCDRWLIECVCGWRSQIPLLRFADGTKIGREIDRRFRDHVLAHGNVEPSIRPAAPGKS